MCRVRTLSATFNEPIIRPRPDFVARATETHDFRFPNKKLLKPRHPIGYIAVMRGLSGHLQQLESLAASDLFLSDTGVEGAGVRVGECRWRVTAGTLGNRWLMNGRRLACNGV